jgi:hypothetical protein
MSAQPGAVDVHLERNEPSDRELVQPRVVGAEHARYPFGRDPVRVGVVEVVPPRVHIAGQRLHVGAGQPTAHVSSRRPEAARLDALGHGSAVAGQDAGSLFLEDAVHRRLGPAPRMTGSLPVVERGAGGWSV